jgi:outer membrane protein TolC
MVRTGWILIVTVPLWLAVMAGCNRHCCLTEAELAPIRGLDQHADPSHCEHDPAAIVATVSTVLHPEGDQRFISLRECIALALENGRVGTTSIRVLAYDPAITHTLIEQSLSRFDATWRSSMAWNSIDERAAVSPLLNVVPGAVTPGGALGGGLLPAVVATAPGVVTGGVVNDFNAGFGSQIIKQLPTGGIAGITFNTDYDLPAGAGPLYRSRLVFGFEQPLLRGAGVDINQVLPSHPGGVLLQGIGGGGEGILITRTDFDLARTKFTGSVQDLLFAVEESYWNLYFAYWNLHVQDKAMQQALDAWQEAKARFDKGLAVEKELSLLETQYQQLRLARLQALGGAGGSVLESERTLRFVVGLPPEDGCRLIPTDRPTVAPYVPNWECSLHEALANRPELIEASREVKKVHLQVKAAKDLLLPDLRFFSSYDINGLGSRLDGAGPNNSLRDLASNHFNNWTVGLQMEVPLGFREAHARVRQAELQLAQRLTALHDLEKQATFALQRSYRHVLETYERVRIQQSLLKAAKEQFDIQFAELGKKIAVPNFLLIAQTNYVAAQRDFRAVVFEYNVALADFERQKGTLMQHDNVTIADGPLPACVQGRASDHIHEREEALVLRERPTCPATCGPSCPTGQPHGVGLGDSPPPIATLVNQHLLQPNPTDVAGRPAGLGEPYPVTHPQQPAATQILPPTTGRN